MVLSLGVHPREAALLPLVNKGYQLISTVAPQIGSLIPCAVQYRVVSFGFLYGTPRSRDLRRTAVPAVLANERRKGNAAQAKTI
jgi:hypothetical protein